MNQGKSTKYFASPERSSQSELERQRQIFAGKNLHAELLDATADCLIVLNKNRQIVYANEAFNKLFGDSVNGNIFGQRPGEVFNCKNAFIDSAGCGTSEFCRTCGAVHAILSSLSGNEDVQECRILIKDSNDALDFRVWAKPLKINNEIFSIYTFTDISNEKRRQNLERIFFHDVLNTAGAIRSFFRVLPEASENEKKELSSKASTLVDKLLEEIQFQRDFLLAETNELEVNLQNCSTLKLIKDVVSQYKNFPIAEGKEIEIETESADQSFISDATLVSRILSNMLKNALEAAEFGEKVKIGSEGKNDIVKFYVHNEGSMEPEIQAQIFQRSFSTKGKGRGLGTYSMKLLTERYLKGRVFFNSSKGEGTTFVLELPLNFPD